MSLMSLNLDTVWQESPRLKGRHHPSAALEVLSGVKHPAAQLQAEKRVLFGDLCQSSWPSLDDFPHCKLRNETKLLEQTVNTKLSPGLLPSPSLLIVPHPLSLTSPPL